MPLWIWPLLALVLLVTAVIVLEQLEPGRVVFIRPENLKNIFNQQAYVGVIAIGMTFVIIAGGIDLSVGSLVALCGLLCIMAATAVQATVGDAAGVMLGFGVALSIGLAAGLLHGVIVTKGLVAPFVATLGGLVAYRSLAVYLADGSEARFIGQDGTAAPMTTLANTGIGIPGTNVAPRAPEPIELLINWPILGFLALAIVAAVVLNRTRFGRHLVAVGANERAARYTGLAVDRIKIAAFAIVGVTAGLAGLLFASRTGAIGSGSTGTLLELDAIAAVVIGGTPLSGGRGTIAGTVIGVLLLGVIATMLPLLNVDTKLQGLVTGVIIVLAVMLQRGR